MNSTSAQSAFRELGYGEDELRLGLPKLEYLSRRDPELFQELVGRCKKASLEEAELWRDWFATFPARPYIESDTSQNHLEMFRMRHHLTEVAVRVCAIAVNHSRLVAETLIGAAWQYRERTGVDWDATRAYIIVVTLMPSGTTASNSETPEAKEKMQYVAKHLPQVMELLPEMYEKKITSLAELQKLMDERFPQAEPEPVLDEVKETGPTDDSGDATLEA